MSTLSLRWIGDLKFVNGPDGPPIELHSSTPGVVSPMVALAYSVMACMAMDVVHVLQKGRHPLTALTVSFTGTRADEPPRRYTGMHLHFDVTGSIDPAAVERAIMLSRTTYCSVANTLRPDLDFKTTVAIHPATS